jgi:F0F1-type ATP synthase delta subunit
MERIEKFWQIAANVEAAGLTGQVEVIEGDIFHLNRIAEQFDYVLAEPILTMLSPPGKAKILAAVCDRQQARTTN